MSALIRRQALDDMSSKSAISLSTVPADLLACDLSRRLGNDLLHVLTASEEIRARMIKKNAAACSILSLPRCPNTVVGWYSGGVKGGGPSLSIACRMIFDLFSASLLLSLVEFGASASLCL